MERRNYLRRNADNLKDEALGGDESWAKAFSILIGSDVPALSQGQRRPLMPAVGSFDLTSECVNPSILQNRLIDRGNSR